MNNSPPRTPILVGFALIASLICLVAIIAEWSIEKDASLVVATIALVWATLMLGLATLFLALVALNEIKQNREDSAKALEAAQKQHEAAIEAGLSQTNLAIKAAEEQAQGERNHASIAALRDRQEARSQLRR